MTADVTFVIPVWNGAPLLRKLLATISAQSCAPKEVIVVDNASTDDAPLVAERWGARVLSMRSNQGFAKASNAGIAQSTTEWVALVNSDVELQPDWLERLVEAATETSAWSATGKILSASDPSRIDGTWDLIAKCGCAWRAGSGRADSEVFSKRRMITMTSATAALYRRELFDRVGNFAEEYESYLEDVDLSLRSAALGFVGVYEPSAVCLHHGSAALGKWSSRGTYLLARNQQLLVRRLFTAEMRRQWRWKITIGQLLWGLMALRHRRFRAWLQSMRDTPGSAAAVLTNNRLAQVIAESEQEIFTLQQQTGMDLYWRLYFLLTGTGSE